MQRPSIGPLLPCFWFNIQVSLSVNYLSIINLHFFAIAKNFFLLSSAANFDSFCQLFVLRSSFYWFLESGFNQYSLVNIIIFYGHLLIKLLG